MFQKYAGIRHYLANECSAECLCLLSHPKKSQFTLNLTWEYTLYISSLYSVEPQCHSSQKSNIICECLVKFALTHEVCLKNGFSVETLTALRDCLLDEGKTDILPHGTLNKTLWNTYTPNLFSLLRLYLSLSVLSAGWDNCNLFIIIFLKYIYTDISYLTFWTLWLFGRKKENKVQVFSFLDCWFTTELELKNVFNLNLITILQLM